MTEFADLTPYEYLPAHQRETRDLVNVGWLGPSQPFASGPVAEGVVDGLLQLVGNLRHVARGHHICELCDEVRLVFVDNPDREVRQRLGTGEFHVTGTDGTIYAAPALVIHYIEAHDYCPPEVFQAAVLAAAARA